MGLASCAAQVLALRLPLPGPWPDDPPAPGNATIGATYSSAPVLHRSRAPAVGSRSELLDPLLRWLCGISFRVKPQPEGVWHAAFARNAYSIGRGEGYRHQTSATPPQPNSANDRPAPFAPFACGNGRSFSYVDTSNGRREYESVSHTQTQSAAENSHRLDSSAQVQSPAQVFRADSPDHPDQPAFEMFHRATQADGRWSQTEARNLAAAGLAAVKADPAVGQNLSGVVIGKGADGTTGRK